ncbi:hypothetical protein EDB83DRAFT_2319483 [Lactarius deliciosus]|nr:hypothetical protein EDB83DRAFT_2319483 [Lactarius deliciosus]
MASLALYATRTRKTVTFKSLAAESRVQKEGKAYDVSGESTDSSTDVRRLQLSAGSKYDDAPKIWTVRRPAGQKTEALSLANTALSPMGPTLSDAPRVKHTWVKHVPDPGRHGNPGEAAEGLVFYKDVAQCWRVLQPRPNDAIIGSGALKETAPVMTDTISHCIFLTFPDQFPRWRSRIGYKERKRREFWVGASKAEEKRRLGRVHALVPHNEGAQWFFDTPAENGFCMSMNGSNQRESSETYAGSDVSPINGINFVEWTSSWSHDVHNALKSETSMHYDEMIIEAAALLS